MQLVPYLLLVGALLHQVIRWTAVAEAEKSARRVLRVSHWWTFPPAPSATALRHHKSLFYSVFGSTTRWLTRLASGRIRQGRPGGGSSQIEPPPSLLVVCVVVLILAILTRSLPVAVFVATLYGLVFPWGMPWSRPKFNVTGLRSLCGNAVGVTVLVGVALLAGITPLLALSISVFLVPLWSAVGLFRAPALSPSGRDAISTRAPNGAWIIDATGVVDLESGIHELRQFSNVSCAGRRFVVTPGLVHDARGSYEIASLAHHSGAALVAVGRVRADALLDGSRGTATRVDTMKQAIRHINERLTEEDAVLYLGDHPLHLP